MKTLSSHMNSHLLQDLTTLCVLWKITRKDGTVEGYADHPFDITYNDGTGSLVYRSVVGFSRTDVSSTNTGSVDNLEVVAFFDTNYLKEEDLRAGKYDGAEVRVMLIDYKNANITGHHVPLRRGWFGEVTLGDYSFQVELRGMTQRLNQTIGIVVSPFCRADLGDSKCGVNLTNFTVTGQVGTVTDNATFSAVSVSGPDRAADWFAGGKLTWTSGANNGTSIEVRSSSALTSGSMSSIVLFLPMPFQVVSGDTFSLVAGCDKRKSTCKTKFNNLVNFRGEPFVPGPDAISTYETGKT